MGKRYALVLGHLMRRNGQLSNDSKRRVEMGACLLKSGIVDVMILSGSAYRTDNSITLADAMRDFALTRCFADPRKIEVDANARDTVGDAFFARRRMDSIEGGSDVDKLYVISSDYHVHRVSEIFYFVFGKGNTLKFISVKSMFAFIHRWKEARSLRSFYSTFDGVTAGDFRSIEDRLLMEHPLYFRE